MMLELKDFIHLPQVDALIAQLVADGSGLVVIAGLDRRPLTLAAAGEGFRPSGRQTIFRIVTRQMLSEQHLEEAVIVAEDRAIVRIPKRLRGKVRLSVVEPSVTYAHCIAAAMRRQPGLLVIDKLCAKNTVAALEAAQGGLRVLSQLDTIFRGQDVTQHLLDLGASLEHLSGLSWVVTVGRVPTLCPRCKQPVSPEPAQLDELCCCYPSLEETLGNGTFFRALGCPDCQHTGRAGDVAVFDFFGAADDATMSFSGPRTLPLEAYILGLAARGYVPLDDVRRIDAEQLRHTYHLLTASERALADANAELQRKLAELEASNKVLQERTEALISLHDVGQALIASTNLDDVAVRVCRNTRELCGAERAILYFSRSDEIAEVLAVSGWNADLVHQQFDAELVFGADVRTEPIPFPRWPPGLPPRHPDVEGVVLRAGLRVPLITQGTRVGLMIVHKTYKPAFTPGEVALLQTCANQAAVAIQRAGLVEQLQDKITQLEAAQAELVEKERMERELELARQVQQSVLPRVFPLMPGYTFGACNKPARQVGGDFYDVILLDGNRFGLVIADVSGKGMPAALYMALTRSLLLSEARRDPSPRAVLNKVHRLLLELGEPDLFVTVFYGVVDGPARRLTYARAGHDRPLLLHEGSAQSLGGDGTFLGFPDLQELHLSEEQLDLSPGDRLVLYTDGLIDALSPEDRRFGLGRFHSTLLSHAHLQPDELCAATFEGVSAFQSDAQQYDDMTMLVVAVE